jgi:hypothetical protein
VKLDQLEQQALKGRKVLWVQWVRKVTKAMQVRQSFQLMLATHRNSAQTGKSSLLLLLAHQACQQLAAR